MAARIKVQVFTDSGMGTEIGTAHSSPSPSRADLLSGYYVKLTSLDTCDSYLWQLVGTPVSPRGVASGATVATSTAQTASFSVDNDGPYMVCLTTVTGGVVSKQYAKLIAPTRFAGIAHPGTQERVASGPDVAIPVDINALAGWSNVQNLALLRLEMLARRTATTGRVLFVDANRGRGNNPQNDPEVMVNLPGEDPADPAGSGIVMTATFHGDFCEIQDAIDYASDCVARAEEALSATYPYYIFVQPGAYAAYTCPAYVFIVHLRMDQLATQGETGAHLQTTTPYQIPDRGITHVLVDTAVNEVKSVYLPWHPYVGQVIVVADSTGHAAAHHVYVRGAGGGAPIITLVSDWVASWWVWTGSDWAHFENARQSDVAGVGAHYEGTNVSYQIPDRGVSHVFCDTGSIGNALIVFLPANPYEGQVVTIVDIGGQAGVAGRGVDVQTSGGGTDLGSVQMNYFAWTLIWRTSLWISYHTNHAPRTISYVNTNLPAAFRASATIVQDAIDESLNRSGGETGVINQSAPYAVADRGIKFVPVITSTYATDVKVPVNPYAGQELYVLDASGNAVTHNITVKDATGTVTIATINTAAGIWHGVWVANTWMTLSLV